MNKPNPTSKLLQVLIIVMGIAGAFLYHAYIYNGPDIPPIPQAIQADNLNKFKTVAGVFDIFDNKSYKVLQQFGEFPVIPGPSGKTNLFAPIQ